MSAQTKKSDKDAEKSKTAVQNVQTGGSLADLSAAVAPTVRDEEKLSPEEYIYLDTFDEDEAEQGFLVSKPTCFLITGKPGVGSTTIAKKLASTWKAELVNPTELIKQNIKDQTDLGKKAQDILMKGGAVPEDMVAKMIDIKIQSPEVAHHGYVLDGFPCLSENNFDLAQQLKMMRNWKLQPDFIINLKIADKDLRTRRIYQKTDPMSGNTYVKEMYAPDKSKKKKKDKSGEEEEQEEEMEEEEQRGDGGEEEEETEEPQDEFFAQVPSDVVERLIVRPEDSPTFVNESIALYKETILHVLEDQMANMDQSFLLELDAILSPTIQAKQLFSRLESYLIAKAAKPLRMSEYIEATEGEEAAGDAGANFADAGESEEAFSALLTKRRLSKKFRWRKSKCAFYCPVSLKDGRIVPGRGSCAAAFLDKVYMMADENALKEFIKNPRPYLRLPQPRAPCKLSVLGCDRSGKTTLATVLAKKYNAKVIDINTIVEPDLQKAKLDMLEKVRGEARAQAIDQLKFKYKEKLEQERIRKEQEAIDRATAAAEAAEAAEGAEGGEGAAQDGAEQTPAAGETEPVAEKKASVPTIAVAVAESPDENSILNDKLISVNEEGDIVVSPEHAEVLGAIEKAVAEASKLSVNLPTADYIKVLENELNSLRQERLKSDPTAPSDGGWILDNFPNTAEQLNAMVENNIIPDTLITLQDASDESNVLMRRWYQESRAEINARIERRLAEEEARRLEEERRLAEIKRAQLAAEAEAAAEFDAENGIASQEPKRDSVAPETLEELQKPLSKILEEDETKDASKHSGSVDGGAGSATAPAAERKPSVDSSGKEIKTLATSVKPPTPVEQPLPPRGPETQEFLNAVKATSELIRGVQNAFITVTGNDPVIIEINKKAASAPGETTPAPAAAASQAGGKLSLDDVRPIEETSREAARQVEKIFHFQAVEFEGLEEDEPDDGEEEEEEEAGEEEEDEEAEEEEEDEENFDPTLKERKVNFGDTGHFCPVTLHTRGVLYPGLIDYQVKYRERVYRFANDELKQQFMDNPELYLPKGKKRLPVPAPRVLVLGPKGAGKSTQARYFADKLDLFHIKFKDYLQELIVGKTKKFVEPEHEEDKQDEEEEEEEDEETEEDLENSQKPPKVEEVLPELTEREETIKAYLEKDEVLPNDILDEVIVQLWTSEPFKSRGFILEGFPNNENEATYMVEKGFMPDAVIVLKVEDEDVVKRLMPPRLEKWRQKMNQKKEKKKQKAAKKKEKLMKKMKERRDEEIAKYEERKKQRELEAAENGDDYEEEEEDFNVDAIIQEEFADELQEEEEVDETNEDEVKENIVTDLKTNFENQTNTIESIKETLQEALIPRFTVPANRKPHIVRYMMQKRLRKFIECRESTFERAYPLKLSTATKLIDFGYKQLSRFGRWCPVRLLENEPMPPLYDDKRKPYPVVHRSYVYFLSSKEARNQFVENPVRYLRQASPLSVVPLRISIVGPPKSGKSTLANRFVKDYGCVRLSVGEAIRAILDNQPDSELATEIRTQLVAGKTVPDELAIQCIEKSILDVKCQLRGYVLDGFPVTRQQVKLMTERSLIPVKIIELKCETREIMQRCIRDRTNPERLAKNLVLNDSPEIIGYKLKSWKSEIGVIRDWYTNEHKNWVELDGQLSKWRVWHDAKAIAFASIRAVQRYLHRIGAHKAASIAELCVTYDEMVNRLGDFGQYCPVSLALRDELVDCSETRSMDYVAEYRGYYYKMHSAHELALFLETPERFVPPKAPRKLPAANLRPLKRKPDEVRAPPPKPVELNGYCPVTYHEGKQRYEALQPGYIEYAAEYRAKIYFMSGPEALDKFMRKPEIYAALRLPHKLPPVKSPLNVFELPMTGFLEQTVADLIKKALNEVGDFKPKFPFLSPTRSALLFVAYYLKAYNPKSSEYRRKKYRQKLTYFQEKCQLIDFLYNQTTVKYKDPTKRSAEYNVKYESFFSLQDNVPTMNWLA